MNHNSDNSLHIASSEQALAAQAGGSLVEAAKSPIIVEGKTRQAGLSLPFDPLRIVDAIYARRWMILFFGIAVGSCLAFLGWKRFETHHVASAQLIKQSGSVAVRQSDIGDAYQPHELAITTLTALMRGAGVMEKTIARLENKYSEGQIKSGLTITPERNTDIVRVTMNSDASSDAASTMLRAYVEEVLTLTRDIQQHDAAEMNRLLTAQIAETDTELIKANEALLTYAKQEELVDADKQMDSYLGELASFNLKYETTRMDHETLDLKIKSVEGELAKVSPAAAKLQHARDELASLQLRYTNEHPSILEAMDRVKTMETVLASDKPSLDAPPKAGESPIGESLYLDLVKLRSEKQVLGETLGKLTRVRDGLNAKLEELPRKSMEFARIKSRKQALETSRNLLAARQREAAMHQENSQGSFRLLSISRLQDVQIDAPTKKIAIAGAGGFAVTAGLLAFLIGLGAARDQRVVTTNDLSRNTGLPVLGALGDHSDAEADEWAFHTWTKLQPRLLSPLPGGATVCGLLTPNSSDAGRMPMLLANAAANRGMSVIIVSPSGGAGLKASLREVLQQPESVLRQLAHAPQQILHLTLDDDWQWNISERQRWQTAITLWAQAADTVILVQLTKPAHANTLLVAERLPNLLWVGESGALPSDNATSHLNTYRAAGCRLVGALLNHAPNFRLGLLNKFATTAACLLFLGTTLGRAEDVVLGPGDAVNISAIGFPEYARNQVSVGPDGDLTYLQAQNIHAAGLTIDQLRSALMTELRRYYKNLLLVVTPMTFQSRKVYVLGKVVKKGSINMDRPLTVLEVIAEAGGLETGLFQQNTVELADLGRSFLMRSNQRMPVNMEALLMHGDMSQNIAVMPDDYLYFPSANSNEIYVLGNVKMQGTQGLLAHTSVHSAVAQAGGFTPNAYTQRVLVVRGSLDKPQAIMVNMNDILAAREKGFRLQPKDIVYVADKPWARAEELLSFAVNAFLQGAVSGWAGANVGPMIKRSILPSVN